MEWMLDDKFFRKQALDGMKDGIPWAKDLNQNDKVTAVKVLIKQMRSGAVKSNPLGAGKAWVDANDRIAEAFLNGMADQDPDFYKNLLPANPKWKNWKADDLNLAKKKEIYNFLMEYMGTMQNAAPSHLVLTKWME